MLAKSRLAIGEGALEEQLITRQTGCSQQRAIQEEEAKGTGMEAVEGTGVEEARSNLPQVPPLSYPSDGTPKRAELKKWMDHIRAKSQSALSDANAATKALHERKKHARERGHLLLSGHIRKGDTIAICCHRREFQVKVV